MKNMLLLLFRVRNVKGRFLMDTIKKWRAQLLAFVDALLIMLAYSMALMFKYNLDIPNVLINELQTNMITIIATYLIVFYLFRMYKSLWTYAGTDEFILAIAGGVVAHFASVLILNLSGFSIPYTIELLAGIFAIILTCGFRISFRIMRRLQIIAGRSSGRKMRALIVGGGQAGSIVINEMKKSKSGSYIPVGIIDDDNYKKGTSILGVKVYGNRQRIVDSANRLEADIILLAIPSLGNKDKSEIIDICKHTNCRIKIIPGVMDFYQNENVLSKIRDVDVEDLLGREPITLEMQGISDYLEGKTIVVTGGGGSIGSELCRQIARFNPMRLVIIDIYENNAYDLQNELKYEFPDLDLKVIIASVRDKKRLDSIFKEFKPDVVFHAAAHKHVPLMEYSPSEAVKNNVFGTLNTAEVADKYGVKRFVLISTDKAVNPTNIMGASKRMCEMVIQGMDTISQTEFVAVRFGNVLGSNGSVIPLFKKQIERGGPVTITHKEITRFFMTIPEAAQLVIQAGAYASGGEIFVLDMGKPVKIYDLALDLIKLSGLTPGKDIEIKVTGLRPGEKLYEELLMDEEGLSKTTHDKIFIGRASQINIDELKSKLEELRFFLDNQSKADIAQKISEVVTTYDVSKYQDEEKMLN